jgi:hypothetical protein
MRTCVTAQISMVSLRCKELFGICEPQHMYASEPLIRNDINDLNFSPVNEYLDHHDSCKPYTLGCPRPRHQKNSVSHVLIFWLVPREPGRARHYIFLLFLS